jgi:DNA repair exonuclease SbcCD ATPase subunit
MQLLKLEVKNWVHHRQRTCNFTRGLVAILGENGSGKSSLFGAIRWLLTGENPNYGVKTDNISQYAKEGEPSYARLEFEHNGRIAVVTRHLLPDKEPATLLVDGKEVARGEKGVTAEIEKLLGVDAKFISRFIIVGQTDIFSFIDDNQADTDKFFQRLFNTSKADKCQDVLGKLLLKLSPPEILKSSAQLLIEQDGIRQQISVLDEQIDKLPTLDAFLKVQESDQETIKQWEQREAAGIELQALNQQAAQNAKNIESYIGNLAEYEKDVAAFVDAISGRAESHREAKIALGHWANYKNIAKVKDKLQAQRADIAKQRVEFPEPPIPTGHSFVQLRSQVDAANLQIEDAERFVRMFTEEGIAECPTCHTPSTQLANQVDEQRKYIESTRALLDDLTAAAAEQSEIEHKRRQWEAMDSKLKALEDQLNESERNLTVVKPPEVTEEDLQQAVSDFEEFDSAQKGLQPVIQNTREQIAKLKGAASTIDERRRYLSDLIAGAKITQADAHMAKSRLALMRDQCGQRQTLEQQKAQLRFDLQRLLEQHETVVKQEAEAVKLRKWSAIADTAREALKNAPRLVAQRNLQRLETAINELLQIFGVNFQVKVANDGSPTFIAEFYDGRRQVAQRLSIGQKTVLALAFRVAVNAMFAEEIGLLALDEPTASLDQPRIQALAPVLEKLRDLSTAKGLQCLLVTHASSLSHLFESTIELEPPELRHARAAG